VKLCNRNFGIGADGMIAVVPSTKADFRMRIFNSDGSEAEMCGNGTRCAVKFFVDYVMESSSKPAASGSTLDIAVETLAGIRTVSAEFKDGTVSMMTVNMGAPILKPSEIPVSVDSEPALDVGIEAAGRSFSANCVSMGNPHAVILIDDPVESFDVARFGSVIEKHSLFPKKTNVEFVNVLSDRELRMRVWERGVGETFACGTGTCATVVAMNLAGKCGREAVVHLLGGDLTIRWADSGDVFMTGPAETVFEGETK
ncbi:MAG TPA: diaminopimelate epimerase, partial [bacterium]|nr:diaminopimelate epimerase [bacterium]